MTFNQQPPTTTTNMFWSDDDDNDDVDFDEYENGDGFIKQISLCQEWFPV